MYINKETIYAEAIKLIADNNIWDYDDNDRELAQQAIYYHGIVDLAIALAKEYDKDA